MSEYVCVCAFVCVCVCVCVEIGEWEECKKTEREIYIF